MKNLIVEISNREGVRIERIALDGNSLSIGRAWDSDLIVQDKFVDPDHLGISLGDDDQVFITDLETKNGSRLDGKKLNTEAKAYRLGALLIIGDTQIKMFDAQASVGPAAIRSNWFLLAERLSSFNAILILTGLAILLQVTQIYSRSGEPLKFEDLMVSAVGVLMLLFLWSLLLGLVAKLIRGESNIKPLWVLGCLAVVIASVVSLILLVIRFNFQDISLGESISVVVFGVFFTCLLAGVFSYVTHFQSLSKWLCSFILVVSLYGVSKSDEYLKEPHQTWTSSSNTEQATLPPAFLLREGVSIDDYLSDTEALFDFQ